MNIDITSRLHREVTTKAYYAWQQKSYYIVNVPCHLAAYEENFQMHINVDFLKLCCHSTMNILF